MVISGQALQTQPGLAQGVSAWPVVRLRPNAAVQGQCTVMMGMSQPSKPDELSGT